MGSFILGVIFIGIPIYLIINKLEKNEEKINELEKTKL